MLFNKDTIKNNVTRNNQCVKGTTVFFSLGPYVPQVSWCRNPSTATNRNCPKVIN